jgi:hypothetical protein
MMVMVVKNESEFNTLHKNIILVLILFSVVMLS